MRLFTQKLSEHQKAALKALAEGIECGAALRPQGIEQLFSRIVPETYTEDEPQQYASCALGAAWECHMIKTGKSVDLDCDVGIGKIDYDDILKAYGVNISLKTIPIMVDGVAIQERISVIELIWHMNDFLKFTRERIAQVLREAE